MSWIRPLVAAAAVVFACVSAQAGPNGPNPPSGGVPGEPIAGGSNFGAAQLYAVVNPDGTVSRGAGVGPSARLSAGTYEVIFKRNIVHCSWTGSIGQPGFSGSVAASHISVTGRGGTNNGVFVQTFNSANAATDLPFHIHILCG